MKIVLDPLYRGMGMHTRYTALNIPLLVFGLVVSVINFSYTGLVLNHVHAPEKGWARVGIDFFAVFTALAILAMLTAWRWPKVASTALWTFTFFFFLDIVAVHVFLPMLIPAVLLAVSSTLASIVEHYSAKSPSVSAGFTP